jgi:hypothetical protein
LRMLGGGALFATREIYGRLRATGDAPRYAGPRDWPIVFTSTRDRGGTRARAGRQPRKSWAHPGGSGVRARLLEGRALFSGREREGCPLFSAPPDLPRPLATHSWSSSSANAFPASAEEELIPSRPGIWEFGARAQKKVRASRFTLFPRVCGTAVGRRGPPARERAVRKSSARLYRAAR